MVLVAATRLRARPLKGLRILVDSLRIARQAARTAGYVDGAILKARRRWYWTVTLWEDEASMRAFVRSGAHAKAMARIGVSAEAFESTRWHQDGTEVPDWPTCHRRLSASGRQRSRRPTTAAMPRALALRCRPKAPRTRP